MRIAVVGATGAVGREMLRILEERRFPSDDVVLLASERSAGARLPFRGEERSVGVLSPDRKSTRLNSSHVSESRMPSSA